MYCDSTMYKIGCTLPMMEKQWEKDTHYNHYVMQSESYSEFHTIFTMLIYVAYNTTDMTGA